MWQEATLAGPCLSKAGVSAENRWRDSVVRKLEGSDIGQSVSNSRRREFLN